MKKITSLLLVVLALNAGAQEITRSVEAADSFYVIVHKDYRMDMLAKKEAEINEAKEKGPRAGKGYRLMVLSTTDRQQAINVRSSLLQRFPDQKVYMSFQPPYVKLKFGNFIEKDEADRYRKNIKSAGIVATNVYLVPEIVEIKADKTKENTEN